MNAGTYEIWYPKTFTVEGKALLQDIGINAQRFYKATEVDRNQYTKMGLDSATFLRQGNLRSRPIRKGRYWRRSG